MARLRVWPIVFAIGLAAGCKADNQVCKHQYGNDCEHDCDCPTGFECALSSKGNPALRSYCYKRCESDRECRAEERCRDTVAGTTGGQTVHYGRCDLACSEAEPCPNWAQCRPVSSHPEGDETQACEWGGAGKVEFPKD